MTNSNRRPIKVLIYADFRSPHAKAWANGMIEAGVTVIRLSSHQVSEFKDDGEKTNAQGTRQRIATWLQTTNGPLGKVIRWLSFRQWIHSIFYLLITSRHEVKAIRAAIEKHQPDLVHSLRIPYESVSVRKAKPNIPWIVSTWGSDFVPQASSDWILRRWTRQVLERADGLMYDSKPDYDRARLAGFNDSKPHLFCIGNLGVDPALFFDTAKPKSLVVYPRKISGFSNYWGFLEAVNETIQFSDATFVAVGLNPIEREIHRRYPRLQNQRFQTTDTLDQGSYAELIRDAKIVVSPNYSDGTPNSILEAIAAGASVIAGDLPQLRDLIADYGLSLELVDPHSAESIAKAITQLLNGPNQATIPLPLEFSRTYNSSRVHRFYHSIRDSARRNLSNR